MNFGSLRVIKLLFYTAFPGSFNVSRVGLTHTKDLGSKWNPVVLGRKLYGTTAQPI